MTRLLPGSAQVLIFQRFSDHPSICCPLLFSVFRGTQGGRLYPRETPPRSWTPVRLKPALSRRASVSPRHIEDDTRKDRADGRGQNGGTDTQGDEGSARCDNKSRRAHRFSALARKCRNRYPLQINWRGH